MKRIRIDVDSWFSDFRTLPPVPGYLPDLGVSSLAIDEASSYATIDAKDLGNPDVLARTSAEAFAKPGWHCATAIAFCFWTGVKCCRCHGLFSAHSPVAKNTLVDCDLGVRAGPAFSTDGPHQNVLMLRPTVEINSRGDAMSLMLYSIEHLDKLVANTWLRVVETLSHDERLEHPPAMLWYRPSALVHGSYWANVCPHCSALQGEHFLKPHPNLPPQAVAKSAMRCAPDLLVVPLLDGQALLGGLCLSRAFVVQFG